MSEPVTLALAALTILAAAFVQGVTGFGHALLAIGVLTWLWGSTQAVLVLTLLAPVIAVALFLKVRREVDWRETLLLSVPLCLVGIPLGILLFSVMDTGLLNRVVGGLLVASAAYFLAPFSPNPERVHPAWAVAAGTTAGFLNGLASTGGPPLVLYLYARRMDKARRIAILQATFVLGSLSKVAQVWPAGMLTGTIWLRAAILTPAVVVGVLSGQVLFRRIPAEPLRKASLLLLLAIGASLLLWG